ncbi:MAG: PilZ domain-containing protein [Candidatus Omnitrophota bacterium]|nr:PilZ domain-containing protein [Candidatus Omnitrophota bacterium]
MKASLQEERRKLPRTDGPPRLTIQLLHPDGPVPADSVNVSGGGLCFRLRRTLEIRSLVHLLLSNGTVSVRGPRSVECTGRVAWVVQRLDLRDSPPFLYDVGVEFVDPPPSLRQLVAQAGATLERLNAADAQRAQKTIAPWTLRGRCFVPTIEREAHPDEPWHLVVMVEGVPCFSGRYASQRAALTAWERFKRQQG